MHIQRNSANTVTGLPCKHFAILVEGAWIFSQTKNEPDRILATCPIVSDDHQCDFGIWKGGDLHPVSGVGSTTMLPGSHFTITATDVDSPADSFTAAFDAAFQKYPFPYMRSDTAIPKEGKPLSFTPRSPAHSGQNLLRTVSIPLPTSIRAAGALLTAEVGGKDKKWLVGGEVSIKRPFVTYLFIYDYRESLTATVETGYGSETVYANDENPRPHLIFRIAPTGAGNVSMSDSVPMTDDQSCQKNHVSQVFDLMRQSICVTKPTEAKQYPLDIGLFHDQNDMQFDLGDTDLTHQELGLPEPDFTHSIKLAACAGGGVPVSPPPGG
jgi:hypothetical protein